MRKVFSLLIVILLLVTTVLGCSQEQPDNDSKSPVSNGVNDGGVSNETVEETTGQTGEAEEVSTELFGVPQETEEYTLFDYVDHEHPYYNIYEETYDMFKGIRGYHYDNRGYTEGFDILNGSSFIVLAGNGEALKIKSIEDRNHDFILVLESVEPGTEFSHDLINVILNKNYKSYSITMADGDKIFEYFEIDTPSKYEGTYKGLTEDDRIIVSDQELEAYSPIFFKQLEEVEIGDTVHIRASLAEGIIYTIEKPEE